jgi:hypothetical protein
VACQKIRLMLLPSEFSCSIKRQYLFNSKTRFLRNLDEPVRIVIRPAWCAFIQQGQRAATIFSTVHVA